LLTDKHSISRGCMQSYGDVQSTFLKVFKATFGGHVDLLDRRGITGTVWSEGGEWPIIRGLPAAMSRPLDDQAFQRYQTSESIAEAVQIAVTGLRSNSVVAINMPCGIGKSTALVKQLASKRLSKRIWVIEPSAALAESLVMFMNNSIQARTYSASFDKGVTYLSGGQFILAGMSGKVRADDLVLLDEAHLVTPVYRFLRLFLQALGVRILALTASGYSDIKAAFGAVAGNRVVEIENSSQVDPSTVLTIGVDHNWEYASSANLLVGQTFEVTSILDTTLRPDPVVEGDDVLFGERVATITEVLQMAGRIGRVSPGVFYYVQTPEVASERGSRLYDRIYEDLSAMVFGTTDTERKSAYTSYMRFAPVDTGVKAKVTTTVIKRSSASLYSGVVSVFSKPLPKGTVFRDLQSVNGEDLVMAQSVLAYQVPPIFSDSEVNAVLHLWNAMSSMVYHGNNRQGAVAASAFHAYFQSYADRVL